MCDLVGDGWLMYFIVCDLNIVDILQVGVIGFVVFQDFFYWILEDLVFVGGFGELEVL